MHGDSLLGNNFFGLDEIFNEFAKIIKNNFVVMLDNYQSKKILIVCYPR